MTYYHDYWVCDGCGEGTADTDWDSWTHEGYDKDYCPECTKQN
ncbi:unnamed protein product, partial [marine sediment metagenome]